MIEFGGCSIEMLDCVSKSIEIKTLCSQANMRPEVFFEQLNIMLEMNNVITWLSELDTVQRRQAIAEIDGFTDDLAEYWDE